MQGAGELAQRGNFNISMMCFCGRLREATASAAELEARSKEPAAQRTT